MDQRFCEFGEYRLDPLQRTLWRGDTVVRLTGREFDILWALALQAGTPVDKAALIGAVWADTNVSNDNLRQHVHALRQKLGKDPNGQEYIRNVPNRGYYLAASVRQTAESYSIQANAFEPEAGQEEMAVESIEQPQQPPEVASAPPIPKKRRRAVLVLASIVSGAAIILAIRLMSNPMSGPSAVTPPPMGRLLTRLTSEGKSIPHVALSHRAYYLAISTDGHQLFAAAPHRHTLSIVNTVDLSVHEMDLPRDAGGMAATRDGRLYIGSSVDGLMVLDIASGRLLPPIIPTGGPVFDIVATPDGAKLFLALGEAGLKRLAIGKSALVQISDRVSAQYLAMDSRGKKLYVSYQDGGPAGHQGHDSIEIFDVENEVSLGIVSGPPMVGGPPAVAPNGGLVLLDGQDACDQPQYDHRGCAVVPSRVFHLIRSSDRQVLRSLSYPQDHGPAKFLDDSRFLLTGGSLSVVDARKYTVLENLDLQADYYRAIVVSPDGRRIYVAGAPGNHLAVLTPEPAECSPPQMGLSLWYSGDGTLDDAAGLTKLEKRGNVAFAPGKVGQAFYLDGRSSYLVAPWTGGYEFSSQDATVTLYAKFAELHGEQTLVYRMAKGETAGMTLLKTADDHLVFQMTASDGQPLSVKTSTGLNQGKWYQIVVTKNDDGIAIYVDGVPENALKFGVGRPNAAGSELETPLNLGARSTGSATLHGWLDEVMFYNRALSADEVRALYQTRESGPCRL